MILELESPLVRAEARIYELELLLRELRMCIELGDPEAKEIALDAIEAAIGTVEHL